MKFKKYLTFIIAVMLCITGTLYAKASSLSSWYYSDEISRVKALNIMDATVNPDSILTRGEFTKAIVIASGLDDEAGLSAGPTIFPDVAPDNPYSGYINVAVSKGLMKGALDRNYHPEGTMTFAQVCTVLVSALGYTASDLPGLWPNNYILKAKALGLADGIDLKDNDSIPRWAAAVMFSRLLDTNIKKASPSDQDKAFADVSGISSDSYQLALITNPVYSKPEIASDVNEYTTNIGSVDLSGNPKIIKDGQLISVSQIEDNDVVYQVSDIWNTKKYILVVDNKVQGEITGITSSGLEIDGKNYEYGSGMDLNKVLASSDEYNKVGDYATLILGYDGKIVGFFDVEHQDNGNYAFVVNYSWDSSGYSVKLLMVDGNMRTFNTDSFPGSYKGELVKFQTNEDDTVTLTGIDYSNQGTLDIDKDKRLIDNYYVSHDVKIFNVASTNVSQDEDVNVGLLNWSDMPSGTLESGKILYMNHIGQFNDVNVIVVNDILNNLSKTGIVKSVTPQTQNIPQVADDGSTTYVQTIVGYSYKIVVDGVEKSWNDDSSKSIASAGNVVDVLLASNGSIDTVKDVKYAENSAGEVDAIDVGRIKIDGISYDLLPNVQVYFVSTSGNYELKSLSDIEADKTYNYISVYLDKPLYNGGKVDTIIVRP